MGKGGSSTSVQIPEWLETAAKRNLGQADKISRVGPVPLSYGPTAAAFTDSQIAGFNNNANTASAFGLNAPGAYSMGTPTEYANGVRAYSAAPLYNQTMDAFAAERPGQKSYIDSFFIDPFTGGVGSNVAPLVNYDNYQTFAEAAAQQQANDLAIAELNKQGSALSAPEFNTYVNTIQEAISDPTYNPATDVLTQAQIDEINNNPDAQLSQDAIYMNQLGNANNTIGDAFTALTGGEPSFDNPSGSDSYGGSLVTGELSTDLLGVPGLIGEVADSIYQDVNFDGAVEAQGENFADMAGSTQNDDGSYDISSWFTDTSATPTNADLAAKTETFSQMGDELTPPQVTYDGSSEKIAPTVSNDDNDFGQISPGGQDAGDGMVWTAMTDTSGNTVTDGFGNPVLTRTSASNVSSLNNDSGGDSNNDGGGGGGGCVVATHAVNAGAFTPSMKREAVVWCMHNLHDKWWGEAIRRGYRTLGRKKIAQGKAHEHYQEFRNYIDFASGKKRTLSGAITFTLRTMQFFAVGLFRKDA